MRRTLSTIMPLTITLMTTLVSVCHPAWPSDPPSPQPEPPGSPEVVATINGEVILLDDLERFLGKMHGSVDGGTGPRAAFDLDRLMFRIVNDVLLGQEARALGMAEEGSIPERLARYRDSLAVKALEREEIAERAGPTDQEIQQTFQDLYRELTLQVVTAYERPDADKLLTELRAGADMETLARERSVDPYAPRGGKVESVARIDLQREIADLASSLAPGELAGPVRTDLGWSLIRLQEMRPASPERLPKVERTVRQLVRHRKSQALRSVLARSAREHHPVRIDQAVVGNLEAERRADARLVPRFPEQPAIVATIGGPAEGTVAQRITVAEYSKALLARWSGVRNREAALASAPIILDRMLEERLLVAEARARGYGERPAIERRVHTFETELLVPRYLEEVVAAGVEVDHPEMEAYYQEHREQFRKPPRVHLGQITVASHEEAERIAGLLRDGTDLAWLARRHSLDRFKDRGGERGWVDLGTSGLNERLLEAKAGTVLDPVGVRGNVVVLKVLARQEQGVYAYDEVSGNVREAVFSRRLSEAIDQLMNTLRERSEIEIDRDLLAGLRVTGAIERPAEAGDTDGHGH